MGQRSRHALLFQPAMPSFQSSPLITQKRLIDMSVCTPTTRHDWGLRGCQLSSRRHFFFLATTTGLSAWYVVLAATLTTSAATCCFGVFLTLISGWFVLFTQIANVCLPFGLPFSLFSHGETGCNAHCFSVKRKYMQIFVIDDKLYKLARMIDFPAYRVRIALDTKRYAR